MCKLTNPIRDYVSLVVMLLLTVALVAGQVDMTAHEAERARLFNIDATDMLQRTRNR